MRAFIKENNLTTAKPMSTGNGPSTMTAVMTDQVDVGWASPPFGLKEIDGGQDAPARARHRRRDRARPDHPRGRRQCAGARETQGRDRRATCRRYRDTIDYMYSDNPQVLKDYAEFAGVSSGYGQARAQRVLPAPLVEPDEIKGLESVMAEAVS